MGLLRSLEWDEYFSPEKFDNDISTHNDKSTIEISLNGHYYIHDVSFIEMKTRSIKYVSQTSPQSILLVEKSIFYANTDTSKDHGGNILFLSSGQCVQSKVCVSNCSSNSGGKHCKIDVTKNSESKNYIEECSFTTLLDTNGKGAFYNYYGYHKINKINITKCENYYYSSFYISSPNKNADITLSNFRNSSSSAGYGITCDSGGDFTYQVSKCNIIAQWCGNGEGVIYVNGYMTIDSCVITDNFATNNYLFYTRVGRGFYVTNSYMNNPRISSNFNPASLTITNAKTKDEVIRLDLYSTASCKAQKHLYRKVFEYENFDSFANNFCETYINDKLCSLFGYLVSTSTLTFFPEIY